MSKEETKKRIDKIFEEAVARLGGNDDVLLCNCFGHLVWEDLHYDWAESCLEALQKNHEIAQYGGTIKFSKHEIGVLEWSLEEVVKLPYDDRFDLTWDYWDGSEEDEDEEDEEE